MEAVVENKLAKNTYPSYKDSGIEWLGELPAHWGLQKIKFLGKVYNGDSLNEGQKKRYASNNPEDLAYISSKDINAGDSSINYENGLRIPIEENKFKVAPKQSSLICIEGGSAGRKIAFTNQEVCFVNKLACVNVHGEISSKYIFYSLRGNPFQTQFKLSMSGLIGGVAISNINNFILPIPPLEEQTRIASFLDRKIAQIDKAITQKERLIELLKERRQITIHQAVTRGLNLDVPMKDSGVEWIGEIPAHWEVQRVKYLFEQSRQTPEKNDGVVTAFRDGEVTLRTNRRTEGFTIAILEQGYQKIKKGQLVLNSMDAFEGAIGVSDSDGKCSPEYVICDPLTTSISPYYYSFLFREMALAKYIQVICNAVRERAIRIRYNNLAPLFVPVPSLKEQNDILSYIEANAQSIKKAIVFKEQELKKLKEYKATLINSAVTGKIKVN